MVIYAATIFASAFLLFLVQPIIAKQILPWFGGSASVWTTCLVFFQFLLLFGYAYSDWVTRHMRPRSQVWLHFALLLVSLCALPIIPDAVWKPEGDEDPVVGILGLLAATIGLPYFLLSTTGPLVQAWFARRFPGATVYRLFALSNFASLLALIAYPPLIEPWTPTRTQSLVWSAGYVLFVVLCALAGLISLRAPASAQTAPGESAVLGDAPAPVARDYLLWLLLAAMGSYMLLAVTSHITQNVASVPFLWILPLVLYLITFIVCFEGRSWYQRRVFLAPLAVIVVIMAWGLNADGDIMDVTDAVPIYCLGLFLCCMFYHGELANLKPSPRYLTRFYLMVSLGGAIGGLSVGVLAPLIFSTYYELGIGLTITGVLALYLLWPLPKWIPAAALGMTVATLYYVHEYVEDLNHNTTISMRNFYGTLRVQETGPVDDPATMRQLMHGVIMHGEQYLDPTLRRQPTSYYGPDSGIGLALKHYEKRPLRVGVIGLGTGTLAAWGKPGDVFRFYELDPQVLSVAQRDFYYLSDSRARIAIALGDARLNLERETPQKFDVLVIDAFSSDSIPVHLVTREALAVYLKHMRPNGIIAFHVTNRYLDLPPVVKMIAAAHGLGATLIAHEPDENDERYSSTDWVLITRDEAFLDSVEVRRTTTEIKAPRRLSLWTDDFNNLLWILK
jgi:hypothetical protein